MIFVAYCGELQKRCLFFFAAYGELETNAQREFFDSGKKKDRNKKNPLRRASKISCCAARNQPRGGCCCAKTAILTQMSSTSAAAQHLINALSYVHTYAPGRALISGPASVAGTATGDARNTPAPQARKPPPEAIFVCDIPGVCTKICLRPSLEKACAMPWNVL